MNCRTTAREVSFGQTCRFVIGGGACWPPAPWACAKTGKPITRTNSTIAIPYALLRFIAAPRSLESKRTNSNCKVKKCPPERTGRFSGWTALLAYLVERATSGIASSFASGDACVVTDAAYQPRNPEESLLYQRAKLGKFVPLYVETSAGCRALGASCIRPPRVSDENALAQRHDARHHERW